MGERNSPLIFYMYDLNTIIIIGFAGAGLILLIDKFLKDFPSVQGIINNKSPWFISKALNCWLCSTFWTTLIILVFFDLYLLLSPIYLFVSWMSSGFIAVLSRFVFVAIQQFVRYEFHVLNNDADHKGHTTSNEE